MILCLHHQLLSVYCAWDKVDGRKCCQQRGVSQKCSALFCQGQLTCDITELLSRSSCSDELANVSNQCMFEQMNPTKPQWDAGYKQNCEGWNSWAGSEKQPSAFTNSKG